MSEKVPVQERERKVDLNSLPQEELDKLSVTFQKMIEDKLGSTLDDLNKTFGVYGLKLDVMWDLNEQGHVPKWQTIEWHMKTLNSYNEKLKQSQKVREERQKASKEKAEEKQPVKKKRTRAASKAKPKTTKKSTTSTRKKSTTTRKRTVKKKTDSASEA